MKSAGFDSSLTVPLSGAWLCQEDGDWGTLIASWSSLDQLGDLSSRSFQLLRPPFCLLAWCHTANWRLRWVLKPFLARLCAQGNTEAAVGQLRSCPSQIGPKPYPASTDHFSGLKGRSSAPTKLMGGVSSSFLCDTLKVPLTGNSSSTGLNPASFPRWSKHFGWEKVESSQEPWGPELRLYLCSPWSGKANFDQKRVCDTPLREGLPGHSPQELPEFPLLSVLLTREGCVVFAIAVFLLPSQGEEDVSLRGGSPWLVPTSISGRSPRNMAEQTLALVSASFISGWLSYLPHSWPIYCCCSTSSFLPSWQRCGQKQPINLFSLWASVLDPGSPVCTCNTCNPQVICHPGVRYFGFWTWHPKKYIQLCLTEIWGFLWNSIIVFPGFFLTFQILFFSHPQNSVLSIERTKLAGARRLWAA